MKINASAGVSCSLVLINKVLIRMSIHNSLANEMLHDIVLGFEIKSLTRLTESNFVANKHSSYNKNLTFPSIDILRLIYKFPISTELTTIF